MLCAMPLPNLAHVLAAWMRPYTVRSVERITVDFVEASVVTARTISAVVQVADKTKLNPDSIDWALRYLQLHSPQQIIVGEIIEFQGADYKVISTSDYQIYGFTEATAEQIK